MIDRESHASGAGNVGRIGNFLEVSLQCDIEREERVIKNAVLS